MSVCILHRSFRRVVARTLMLAGLAVMLAGPLAATRASAAEVTILEDDYAAALGKAKARGVLLFVDGWAPWCHSCVFFREHVLPNASLGDLADRYVFASIDTEKEINRRFVERFPMTAWPTFFVIDPSTEKVRWVGTQLLDRAGLQRTLENEDALFRR